MPPHAAAHWGLSGWAMASGLAFGPGACLSEVNGSLAEVHRQLDRVDATLHLVQGRLNHLQEGLAQVHRSVEARRPQLALAALLMGDEPLKHLHGHPAC